MHSDIIKIQNKYNQHIMLYKHDRISRSIINSGIYDAVGIYFIEKILSLMHEPIALDIGANVGNHALVMTRYCKELHLFEPQQDIVQLLEQTKSANQISNWHIHPFGLADVETTLPLYKHLQQNNGASTFTTDEKSYQYCLETCEVKKGDNWIKQQALAKLDFIKIDVEGYEAKVINGLRKTIQQFRPIIMLEWNNNNTKQEFFEFNIFENVLQNYNAISISHNKHKSHWNNTWLSRFHRFCYINLVKKKWSLTSFDKLKDYQHVLFIPQENKLNNELQDTTIANNYFAKF